MKKYIKYSLVCAILGLLFGVYYREFTKGFDFTDYTMLRVIHPHVIVYGVIFIFLMGLILEKYEVKNKRFFDISFCCFNGGLLFTAIMMCVRGSL